jgi:TRAP-type C4-dicarboxylate transport system substrate-binding protein
MRRLHLSRFLSATAAAALACTPAAAEDIKLRMASGHALAQSSVNIMSKFFGPEIKKRVEATTPHKIEFIEGYGGAMVKPADVMEGVQTGIVDIGLWFFPFEPSNLPLHSFQALVPFGTMSSQDSVRIARTVYDKVPFMTKVLEDKFGQVLIGLAGDNGYNIMTVADWSSLADLKGRKISGAGINLKWLESAGVIGVQMTAPEVYTALQTGVVQGVLIFPSIPVNLKWTEVAKTYTLVGFGSITWQAITMNKARLQKLPREVQDIIVAVGREYEAMTAKSSDEDYPKLLDTMKSNGVNVKTVPEGVRIDWAKSLTKWPQERADELNGKGLPASQVLRMVVEEAEKLGYKWPVRYEIK